ncbi:hypothetical protein ACEPPN_000786 [Leptodophora sp. 'Broadleaf-Isolate-01']
MAFDFLVIPAISANLNAQNLGAWDRSKITSEVIQRRITSSSKGLIEIRDKIVQFIHDSVKDFLLRNRRLQTLDPALELNAIGTSHDCLKACCISYLMMEELRLPKDRSQAKDLNFSYPFLEYASTYILEHAEDAQARGVEQRGFIQLLQEHDEVFKRVRLFHNAFETAPDLGCAGGANLLYVLSFHGYGELVNVLLERGTDVNAVGGVYGSALQAASAEGNEAIVSILLEKGADVNIQGGQYGNALQAASAEGNEAIVSMLLEKGADVNELTPEISDVRITQELGGKLGEN